MHSGVGRRGEELRTEVADIEKLKALMESVPTRGQSKKRPNVTRKSFTALEARLKAAQNVQKGIVDAAVKSKKQTKMLHLSWQTQLCASLESSPDFCVIKKLADLEQ